MKSLANPLLPPALWYVSDGGAGEAGWSRERKGGDKKKEEGFGDWSRLLEWRFPRFPKTATPRPMHQSSRRDISPTLHG